MTDIAHWRTAMGDRLLLEDGRADAERAAKIYPNQGLHTAAVAFAIAHERAIQYLEQAPVLVLAALVGGKEMQRTSALFLQHRLVPLCERGAPLKDVLRAFNIAPPLRKLRASSLFPMHGMVVASMWTLDPAVLGRIVPDKPGAQKTWLSACSEWRNHLYRRRRPSDTRYAWAVENLALSGIHKREVGVVCDFAASREHFNEAWRWPRAVEEANIWHDQITIEAMLRGTPFHAESGIDMGKHRDRAVLIDHEFVALRTPTAIAEEGKAMRHCVASYIPDVVNGRCHIVSIRKNGERLATLELSKTLSVKQLRGKLNASPTQLTASAAHLYAEMEKERLK